jgi:predicted membrane protein (TIGR00267 family)
MSMFARLRYLVELSRAHRIARRYFITNGFDGVLAMLGLLMGFRVTATGSLEVMIGACLGTAVALLMSGLTSAYISESAEKEHELRELEKSMVAPMDNSAHAEAARLMPWLIALVNGLSPLLLALLILLPLLLAQQGLWPLFAPLDSAIVIALVLSFLLGAFLGRLSSRFWLWTGIRALLIAMVTALFILLLNQLLEQS